MINDIDNIPALLVIDVQKGLAEASLGARNNPDAEANISALLGAWRKQDRPIIHIRHCSTEPDSPLRPELPGNAYKDEVQQRRSPAPARGKGVYQDG